MNQPNAEITIGQGLVASWAKGGKAFTFPNVTGYKLGPNGARYIILEIHLNNPDGLSGNIITSGIRLFTSSKLRKYDAGTLLLVSERRNPGCKMS